jgi:hypothetical protein
MITNRFIKTSKPIVAMASIAALLVVAACGGAGGGAEGTAGSGSSTLLSGLAVDGYLQGSSVFLDLNSNGILDAGEPSATTDTNGRYSLNYNGVTGLITGLPIVVTGGIDSDTGFAFAGQLKANADIAAQGQVVTPLTTLVNAMVTEGLASSVSSAKTMVANSLGLTVEQLSVDPIAAIANAPAIYTKTVALQRAIQLLASANAVSGEGSHQSQERVVRALALAISSQSSPVDVAQLVAALPLQHATEARTLATSVEDSVRTSLSTGGHDRAKSALKGMDQIRVRMESDHDYSITSAANNLDSEQGRTTSRPYYQLAQNSGSTSAVTTIQNLVGQPVATVLQPANSSGRLLASNCFQCHGTGGVGGFESIRRGEASEIREYLSQAANSGIMAAHAQGYTMAQINSIITYLQQ